MAFKLPSLFKKKEPPIREPKRIPILESKLIDEYLAASENKRAELYQENKRFRLHNTRYPMWGHTKSWYTIKDLDGLDFELEFKMLQLNVGANILTEKEYSFRYYKGNIIVIKDYMSWFKFYNEVLEYIPEIFVRIPDLTSDMVDSDMRFYPSEPVLKSERTDLKYFYRDIIRNKIFGYSESLKLMSESYSYREEKLEEYAKKRIVESYQNFRIPLVELGKMVKDGYQVIYPETHMEGLIELYLCYVELTFMQDLVIFFKNKNDDYIGLRNSESNYTSYYIPLENKVNEEIHKKMRIHGGIPREYSSWER